MGCLLHDDPHTAFILILASYLYRYSSFRNQLYLDTHETPLSENDSEVR